MWNLARCIPLQVATSPQRRVRGELSPTHPQSLYVGGQKGPPATRVANEPATAIMRARRSLMEPSFQSITGQPQAPEVC